jgi:hypothetical protein
MMRLCAVAELPPHLDAGANTEEEQGQEHHDGGSAAFDVVLGGVVTPDSLWRWASPAHTRPISVEDRAGEFPVRGPVAPGKICVDCETKGHS